MTCKLEAMSCHSEQCSQFSLYIICQLLAKTPSPPRSSFSDTITTWADGVKYGSTLLSPIPTTHGPNQTSTAEQQFQTSVHTLCSCCWPLDSSTNFIKAFKTRLHYHIHGTSQVPCWLLMTYVNKKISAIQNISFSAFVDPMLTCDNATWV